MNGDGQPLKGPDDAPPGPVVVVAGLGNEYRRDDGAGPLAAARIAEKLAALDIGPVVDPLDLLGRWDHADLAVIVDAVRSGSPPGTVQLVELPAQGVGRPVTSTHGIDLAGVLRLARTVGGAPGRVLVVGIEGADFGDGTGLSPEVDAAVTVAVQKVVDLIEEVTPCA